MKMGEEEETPRRILNEEIHHNKLECWYRGKFDHQKKKVGIINGRQLTNYATKLWQW